MSELEVDLVGNPLSFAQERIWFLWKLAPSNSSYNLSTAWRCYGSLHVEGLQWALQEAVRRHEVLQSVFAEFEGVPRQIVHKGFELKLPVVDLGNAELVAICNEEVLKPF